jgi:peptide/nickel transport system substrate-binding protein
LADDLANVNYTDMEQRAEMFKRSIVERFEYSYRVWIVDGKSFAAWDPKVSVAYDLMAGVDGSAFWPYTLRFDGQEGGVMRFGTNAVFNDPINAVAGSNWAFDQSWIRAIGDYGVVTNPFTGVAMPQRIEKADVVVQTGLPVTQTYDWVNLTFEDTITVPEDAWVDWDVESQTFITAAEKWPEGATALRKSVVYYPADFFQTVTWHDGSPFDIADFVMGMIMTFEPGYEGSAIYDEAAAATIQSALAPFKGWKILSEDPLIVETYSDFWGLDAENIVNTLWPEYGYGNASWHLIALSNMADAKGELAYSADKADAAGVEWLSWASGPSIEILAADLAELIANPTIPYEATLGAYITPEEAAARYANLQAFYEEYGHFYANCGPLILSEVYPVEQTLVLKNNDNYVDFADKWSLFTEPKVAVAEIDGAGRVTIGEAATFDVFVSTEDGDAYPRNEVSFVKYLLFNADGSLLEVAEATFVEDGYYMIELSEETTGKLASGACKLEVAVSVIPVALPAFAAFEFVAE